MKIKIVDLYISGLIFLEKIGSSVFLFFIRFWMARIFWYSGLTKISNWQSTIYLFQDEYRVPFIPPEIAAYLSTTVELSCPILLILGIATRLAAIPMLAMTAVIEFTYLDLIDHSYWAMLLVLIILYGPGTISIDNLIWQKYQKRLRHV